MYREIACDLREHWRRLALTSCAYKMLAIAVLAPLVSLVSRAGLALSGDSVLTDQDVLFFLLRPTGWVAFVMVMSVGISVAMLEFAALLAILNDRTGALSLALAIRFAFANIRPLLLMTSRCVAYTLLAVAPLLALAAACYFILLGEFDINFYLAERPPEFNLAIGIGVVLLLGLAAVLLRLFSNWFFALPVLVFENVPPSQSLAMSKARVHGRRGRVIAWLVAWLVASNVLGGMITAVIVAAGAAIVPQFAANVVLLSLAIGVVLLSWGGLELIAHLASNIVLATILYRFYAQDAPNLEEGVGQGSPRIDAVGWSQRLKTGHILGGGLVAVLAAAIIGALTLDSVRLEDDVVIMAHRGASTKAPENTLAAIRQAIEDGADFVEIDVQETADDEVVVFHDSDFMKLANVPLKIWDATMADLKEIDIGSWFDSRFADERTPTLAQVLQLCRGKAGVNIELKYYGHEKELEKRVAEIVDAHDMGSDVVVMSLKADAVRKMKKMRPNWRVGQLLSVSAGDPTKLDVDFLAMNASFVDRDFIIASHKRGKEVYTWTVNDPVQMSVLIGKGVDGLITDEPAIARSVLQQRAEMSVPERLLLGLAELFGATPK